MPDRSFPLDDGFFRRVVTRAHFALWRVGALGFMDPQDLAQDLLVDLYGLWTAGRLDTSEPGPMLRGIVATMARRSALDAARRRRVRRVDPAPHPNPALVGTVAALDRFPGAFLSTTRRIERLDDRERAIEILDFIARREVVNPANAGDYEILILRRVEGLTYLEISRRRGIGESAEHIRSRLRRLEAAIRAHFQGSEGHS